MFYKKYEVWSPCDLAWIEVVRNVENGKIVISHNKTGESIVICDGSPHQLSELIALLTKLRTEYPATERNFDESDIESLPEKSNSEGRSSNSTKAGRSEVE